jgi:hypothetical protein
VGGQERIYIEGRTSDTKLGEQHPGHLPHFSCERGTTHSMRDGAAARTPSCRVLLDGMSLSAAATVTTTDTSVAAANEPMRTRGRPRVVVEVEAPDSAELVEALAGEFVAGMAALACEVIAEEQRSTWMSEHDRYYENGQ